MGEDEGTAIVHIAPGAGPEDFALGKEHGLAVVAPLDENGHYVDGFGWLTGSSVFDVRDRIFADLEGKGLLYCTEEHQHRYPFCWRCNSELVFRVVDEWFISMDELRHTMMEITRKVRWIPAFGLERELDWLRNMHDWMISKKRYWGLALPIWNCDACGSFEVIGSEHELEERALEGWQEFAGHSPHRPWIDGVKIACSSCGEKISRIRDVGNPWLDAGIVPFSTIGYRNDRDHWRDWFPADWISESFPGQFRNWFYSLLAMSATLEETEPFKACFSYALLRDEHGAEMHKSKGNAIWFEDAADKMGVDVMRWMYLRHTPANNLNFGYSPGDEVRRQFHIPIWNVYSFFVNYANIDGWQAGNRRRRLRRASRSSPNWTAGSGRSCIRRRGRSPRRLRPGVLKRPPPCWNGSWTRSPTGTCAAAGAASGAASRSSRRPRRRRRSSTRSWPSTAPTSALPTRPCTSA